MALRVEFAPAAARELRKIDRPIAQRLVMFFGERVRRGTDPRAVGEALRGDRFAVYWKYRVGDYRLICRIEDKRIVVTVVRIGHRGDVYRT